MRRIRRPAFDAVQEEIFDWSEVEGEVDKWVSKYQALSDTMTSGNIPPDVAPRLFRFAMVSEEALGSSTCTVLQKYDEPLAELIPGYHTLEKTLSGKHVPARFLSPLFEILMVRDCCI